MKTLFAAGLLLLFAQAHAACDLTAWQAPREKECVRAWMDENPEERKKEAAAKPAPEAR